MAGGLGSQLLGMMEGLTRRKLGQKVSIDTSYFSPQHDHLTQHDLDVVHRAWELDRYGLFPENFDMSRPPLRQPPDPHDSRRYSGELVRKIWNEDWSDVFPIAAETEQALTEIGLKTSDDFASVHIRRGDYLAVSSRVLSIDETLLMVGALKDCLPRTVIFFSDSDFSDQDKQSVHGSCLSSDIHFANFNDIHVVHGIMRKSRVLVCANSTFSWSAGILNTVPGATVLAPQHFFGLGKGVVNGYFQAGSDWMIRRPGGA